MKKFLLGFLLVFCSWTLQAQFSIIGKVNSADGEALVGANVLIVNSFKGSQTNSKGLFTIPNLAEGTYELEISYIGYEKQYKTVEIGNQDEEITIALSKSAYVSDEIVVSATRATNKTATTYTNVDKEELEKNNLGQDIPYLLDLTPSVVVTSDAGAGIGYTGIRVRGSDPTRINVTINGIPVNDAESQGVFWVNLPDLASTTENVQIQRGVGTSTSGAGAFGATVNLLTNTLNKDFSGELNNAIGSFGTIKSTVKLSSGLLANKFTLDGQVSRIVSDGYIDRASSNLNSLYLTGAYYGNQQSLKINLLKGAERTYQAWYGISADQLMTDRTFNPAGTEAPGLPYANQVDDYGQTHLQLHYLNDISDLLTFNTSLYYTKGAGFYEEYKAGESPSDYGLISAGLIDPSVLATDIIRRRWLDNDLYGAIFNVNYNSDNKKTQVTIGGGYNIYLGDHFGEVIDTIANGSLPFLHRYYDNDATKSDFNIYGKLNYQLANGLDGYLDLQYRNVGYNYLGVDEDGSALDQDLNLNFFNPKIGLTYTLNPNTSFYAYYGIANKEPNRSDYVDAPPSTRPVSERLYDLEIGYRQNFKNAAINLNFYRMDYDNQLVVSGLLNDVGAYVRTNIEDSYRMGLELEGALKINDLLQWRVNATLSENRVVTFTEYVDDWTNGGQVAIQHENTNLAFSPSLIAGSELAFYPLASNQRLHSNQLEIAWLTKYVGDQYIDNTSSTGSLLPAYLTNDIRLGYTLKLKDNTTLGAVFKQIQVTALVRNLFDTLYESNAWIYRYQLDGTVSQLVGYYPQAGRHFYVGLNLKF